ncbi:hypothetical protein EVAR_81039_1 [Eumeta japonica]|uniref:Uncharacterized protein n=1 Tax=Eumeta variegata TaxID=151549 RepID=A0A4C1T877_EUMVA|nr:hypothetical protein EVAR_81039_1 [Eumeta japonica]
MVSRILMMKPDGNYRNPVTKRYNPIEFRPNDTLVSLTDGGRESPIRRPPVLHPRLLVLKSKLRPRPQCRTSIAKFVRNTRSAFKIDTGWLSGVQ